MTKGVPWLCVRPKGLGLCGKLGVDQEPWVVALDSAVIYTTWESQRSQISCLHNEAVGQVSSELPSWVSVPSCR